MVRVKRMNESALAEELRILNVAGEIVRSRQEEKQGLLDEFDATSKRFFFGKISERALASSVKKTNNELKRLNGDIRFNISRLRAASNRVIALAARQAPIGFRATLSGTSGGGAKKKAKKVRRSVRKKVKKARRPARKPAKRKVKKVRRPVRRRVKRTRKKTSKKK